MLLFSACGQVPKHWDPQDYTVKQGDTLYSIAWRYEKDFLQMARINNLRAPYEIFPGQRLHMNVGTKHSNKKSHSHPLSKASVKQIRLKSQQSRQKKKKSYTYVRVKKNDTLFGIALREGYSLSQLVRWNHLKSPYIIQKGQVIRLHPTYRSKAVSTHAKSISIHRNVTKSVKKSDRPKHKNTVQPNRLPNNVNSWAWPVKGRVVQTYKHNVALRKGIAVKGTSGQPIKAAASGIVVYSGNGLINYGELIIIKHSHDLLSAYAYNQSLLVKEGDFVKQGQTVAKMGKFDGKPLLHFEIRKNGKPVNPLTYLPKL